jgi:hypothetical protein
MAIQIDKAGQLQRGAQAAGASLAQLGTGVADLLDPNRGLKQQVKEMLATDPTKAQALARSARKNDKSFRKIIGDDLTDQLLQIPPDLDETLGQEVEQGLTALQAGTPFTDLPPLVQWVLSNKVGAGGPLKFSTEPKIAKGAEQVLSEDETQIQAAETAIFGKPKKILDAEVKEADVQGLMSEVTGEFLEGLSPELRQEAVARMRGLTRHQDAKDLLFLTNQLDTDMENLRQRHRIALAKINNQNDLDVAAGRQQVAIDNFVRNRALIEGGYYKRKLGVDAPLEAYANWILGSSGNTPEEQQQITAIREAYTSADAGTKLADISRLQLSVKRLQDAMDADVRKAQEQLPAVNGMLKRMEDVFGIDVQLTIQDRRIKSDRLLFVVGGESMDAKAFNAFLLEKMIEIEGTETTDAAPAALTPNEFGLPNPAELSEPSR